MKKSLFVFFVTLSSFAFGQYGHWEKTTRGQWWPCKMTWDEPRDKGDKNLSTDSGFVNVIDHKFYPGPFDAKVRVPDRWLPNKKFKDANGKPVDGVHHCEYTDLKTGEKIVW